MADVEVGRHTCKECGRSYNKNWRLEEHLRSHNGERPYKCTFEGCDKSYIRPYHLKRHSLIHTGQQASFKCSYPGCTQTCTDKHGLKRHEQRSHNHPFKCEYEECNKSFKKSSQLRRHTCLHTNESLFRCQVEGCGRGFDSSPRLLRHMKVHNKGYICSVPGCSEAFSKFSELAVHIRSHGFVCEHCKRTFSEVWELKRHAQIHSSNRKMYECPREGCSRVYTKAYNLRVHIKAFHDGNRPYVCTVEWCGKGFAHKVSLRQHLVLHSQNKIKPRPPPSDKSTQKKKSKKKRKPISLAKQLSGYRSSHSESSDTYTVETAPKKRKAPSQPQSKTRQSNNNYSSTSSRDIAETVNVMSTCESSVTTVANMGRSGETQVHETSNPLSNVMPSNESPVTTSADRDGPEEMQVCSSVANTNTHRNKFEDKPVSIAPDTASNLTSSANGSAITAANSDNGSSMITASVNRAPTTSISHQQNGPVHSSSDEKVEDMEWEPAVDNCLLEADYHTEHVFEGMDNDTSTFCDRSANVGGWSDERLPGNGTDSSRQAVREERSSGVLTTVHSMERSDESCSQQRDDSMSPLPVASSVVETEDSGVRRNQKIRKNGKKRMKKSRKFNIEDSTSRALVTRDNSLVTRLDVSFNSSNGNEDVNALESSDFPGMDDMLQVIIEEEDGECAKGQCETRFENGDVNLKEGNIFDNSPGQVDFSCNKERYSDKDLTSSGIHVIGSESRVPGTVTSCSERPIRSSEKHLTNSDEHVIGPEKQVVGIPRDELAIEETQVDGDRLRSVCTVVNPSNGIGGFSVKQDVFEDDNFGNISNDCHDIGSDDEGMNVSEQQARDSSTPVTQVARDEEARKVGCSDGLTDDAHNVGTSRALTRDKGRCKGQVARDRNGRKSGPTSRDMIRVEDSHFSKITTESKDTEDNISTNTEVGRTLPQSTNTKRPSNKDEKNVGGKPPAYKRASRRRAKPTVPNTAQARGKSSKHSSGIGGDNSERNDLPSQTKTESSRTSTKPESDIEPAEPQEDVSKAKFRSRSNIFTCDLQTLELLWNFKGK